MFMRSNKANHKKRRSKMEKLSNILVSMLNSFESSKTPEEIHLEKLNIKAESLGYENAYDQILQELRNKYQPYNDEEMLASTILERAIQNEISIEFVMKAMM